MSTMSLSRREFIRNVSLSSGALSLGFQLTACSSANMPSAGPDEFAPNAYLRLTPSGEVQLQLPKAEMGQGVSTGFATVVAEELDVNPASIQIQMAPVHEAYGDPETYLQITGGSNSMRVHYPILRQAGASAREALLQAAVIDSGLSIEDLYTDNGELVSTNGNYRRSYGQLVALARDIPVTPQARLKDPAKFQYIGRHSRRIDAAQKTDGSARFGIDCRPPGCVTAVVARNPQLGGELRLIDDAKARAVNGVIDVVAISSGIAVIAQGYWPATKAAKLLQLEYIDAQSALPADSAAIQQYMQQQLDAGEFKQIAQREADQEGAGDSISAQYCVPFLAHAAMEPQNATVWLRDGQCEIWVGSQSPDIARGAAANVLKLPAEKVVVHNQLLGGGFGRRAMADNVAEAAEIALHTQGKPVQLVWSREDDTRHDFYRPAFMGAVEARVDKQGRISDWHHRIVGPSLTQQLASVLAPAVMPGWVPAGLLQMMSDYVAAKDFSSTEGADDVAYQLNGYSVEYCNTPTQIPLGYWRSVGHSHTAFVVESFMDELALQAGIDPVAFRLANLPEQSKSYRVLKAVAQAANWGQPSPSRYQGVAVHSSFHSTVAQVVEISMQGDKPRLERVFCAIDCGQVINPEIVEDQMVGAVVFGLTAALYGAIEFEDGAAKQSNFHDYRLLRHNEVPEVEVIILPSTEAPTGVGEPAVPPTAPALANALYAATGKRQRSLPLV